MIHPTRTNLLLLRDKRSAIAGSVVLLKGRRQVLLREFLHVSAPLVRFRERLAQLYEEALHELDATRPVEGAMFLHAAAVAARRDFGVQVEERNLLGLHYREVTSTRQPRRAPTEREYDERLTTPRLEEAIDRFETIVAEMFELAVYEGKVKRLGDELLRLTRRIRVLESRVIPGLELQVREITRFLSEREREAYFRLKLFKEKRDT